ncbi:MAG: VOC family protein [Pseudomonadales bacterium]
MVLAHPNLELAKEEFADLTGCMPANGGPHLGGGTHNALASLGESVYIELISPDPGQMDSQGQATGQLAARLAAYEGSQLLAWAIRSNDLIGLSNGLSGLEAAHPFDMSRKQPNGHILHWKLMSLTNHELRGFAPFFIDWLDCPHPATANPVAGQFESLEVMHSNAALGELVATIDGVEFQRGPPSFTLRFNAERGPVVLGSDKLEGFWP